MITVARKPLAEALSWVGKAVEGRTMIPILQCLRLEAGGGHLRIVGTNLDMWAERTLEAEGELAACCVGSAGLGRVASLAVGDNITVELRPTGLMVRHGGGKALLGTLPADDFPLHDERRAAAAIELDGGNLAALAGRVLPCVSAEQTQVYLRGACLEGRPGGFTLTSTDGRRLAHGGLDAEVEGEIEPIIVPASALRLLARSAGPARLTLQAGRIEAAWDGHRLVSRLIDGSYPDWRRIISGELPHAVEVDAAELGAAARRVGWVEKFCGMRVADGQIRLWAQNGANKAAAELACDGDEEGQLGFQAAFLADLAEYSGAQRLRMSWNGGIGPVRFDDPERPGELHIVMPARMDFVPPEELTDA